MRLFSRYAVLFLAVAAVSFPAFAEEKDLTKLTRKEAYTLLMDRIEQVPHYEVQMKILRYIDPDEANMTLVYDKPGRIAIRQLGPYKKGGEIDIYPDGKILVEGGGLLSILPKISVAPDSKLIVGITGDSALAASWQGGIKKALDHDAACTGFTVEKVEDGKQYLLHSRFNEEITDIKTYVDAERLLIVKIDRYKGDKHFTRVTWEKISLGEPPAAPAETPPAAAKPAK